MMKSHRCCYLLLEVSWGVQGAGSTIPGLASQGKFRLTVLRNSNNLSKEFESVYQAGCGMRPGISKDAVW